MDVAEVKTHEGRAVGPNEALYRVGSHLCGFVLMVGELIQQKQKVHRVIILVRSAMINLNKVGVNAFSLTK